MVKRKDIKAQHEHAVLKQFSSYLEGDGHEIRILHKPDPPDAIVELNQQKTWIEITDAFLDEAHAIGLTTSVCDDKEHRSDSNRLVFDPDCKFSAVLHSVIEAKYDKTTMHSIAEAHGGGILLVGIFTPFKSAKDIAQDESVNIANLIATKAIKIFDYIYVYDGTGKRYFHLIYNAKPLIQRR